MKYNTLVSTIKDPALMTRWQVRMPNMASDFAIMALTVEIASRNVAAKDRYAQGKQFKRPDVSTLDDLTIGFYETHDFTVTDYMNAWDGKVRNSDGSYNPPTSYWRDIVVEMLAYEDDTVVKTFTFKNCWPTTSGNWSLSYEDPNGTIIFTQTFAVDDDVYQT
jgi:hypothetical protein